MPAPDPLTYYAEVDGLDADVVRLFSHAEEVCSAAQVDQAMDQTAVRITLDMQDLNPLVVTVMHGGLVCAGMLMRRLVFPLEQGYIHVSRYRQETEGGEFNWLANGCPDLRGRHVLLVDDILDQGRTLHELLNWCSAQGAASVRSCVLVCKDFAQPLARPSVDYIAVHAPDRFLIGCGMDFKGYGRNLPGLYALDESLL
ncbi:MAG: hypoxanthine-guanine phosphoribosyltransferase [Pseudomonadota bacterium]